MKLNDPIGNPFRPLFFVGSLSAVLGALLWVLFQRQLISFFPKQSHANLMFLGFLWSFVAGFLMTALPKMTQTLQARRWEVILAILLPCLQILFAYLNSSEWVPLIGLFQFLFLCLYLLRRFILSRQIPFEGFLFVPFAFLSFFAGLIFVLNKQVPAFYLFSGQAFILNLICGLGSRLIPAISRVPQALLSDQNTMQKKYLQYFFFALFLNSSFLLESLGLVQIGLFVRALFLVVFSIQYFKLFQFPLSLTWNGWGLKISIVFLILGYLLAGLIPEQQLALLHFSYIGGFTLLTLMVATRVSLVHNGAGMQYELSAKVVLPSLTLFLIAAIMRPIPLGDVGSEFVFCAALFFIAAQLCWYFLIGRKTK